MTPEAADYPGKTRAAQSDFPHTDRLHRNIVKWIEKNLLTPEYTEFKRKQLEYLLYDVFDPKIQSFLFSPDIEKQHALIVAFHGIYQTQRTLSQCEYYFRRFTFRGLPITKDEHLRNICEFYFSLFYIMKNRIKFTLNTLKTTSSGAQLNIGGFIRSFEKEFDYELRARHRVHHRDPFDDAGIDRISITGIISEADGCLGEDWRRQHLGAYRKFSKQWSLSARRRSRAMQAFVEEVARAILTEAEFLKFPDQPNASAIDIANVD